MPTAALTAAAACAALLMGAEPVLPDRYVDATPGSRFCAAAGRANCSGVFLVWASGRTTIVARRDDFSIQVHEACHAIQHAQGRPLAEPECEAIQARAPECGGLL